MSSRSTICIRLLAVALSIWGYVFFFLLPRVTVQSSYVTIRQKICRPCFQKTSHITRDTEVPGPLNNTYFKLQLCILTYYSPFTLLVTTIYTKCFFLFSMCVTTKLSRINNGNRTEWSPIRSVIIQVINKIWRPRSGSPICLITRAITDRTGRHEVLLPINHNRYNFRENKCILFSWKSIWIPNVQN